MVVLKSIPIREYPCGCWTTLESPHKVHLCSIHMLEINRTDNNYWFTEEVKIKQRNILELVK